MQQESFRYHESVASYAKSSVAVVDRVAVTADEGLTGRIKTLTDHVTSTKIELTPGHNPCIISRNIANIWSQGSVVEESSV